VVCYFYVFVRGPNFIKFVYYIAPSSPPLNVSVTSLSPTSLFIIWDAPEAINRNGFIHTYVIELNQTQFPQLRESIRDEGNVSSGFRESRTISGLEEGVEFTVTIMAINNAGISPPSEPVIQTTLQARMSI